MKYYNNINYPNHLELSFLIKSGYEFKVSNLLNFPTRDFLHEHKSECE